MGQVLFLCIYEYVNRANKIRRGNSRNSSVTHANGGGSGIDRRRD